MITLNYYKFICCRAPLEHVINLAGKVKGNTKIWQLRRTCPFSLDVIKNFDHFNKSLPESLPESPDVIREIHSQMLFYSPKCNPLYTVGMIDRERTWYVWLGNQDPNLETLSLRFTHTMKNEDAIRELEYLKGIKTVRILRVMRDNPRGWDFYQDGEQQPFEEGKSYEKIKGKRLQEYFTFEDMLKFATNWGCPFGDDNFWDSESEMYSFGMLPKDEILAAWKTHQHFPCEKFE